MKKNGMRPVPPGEVLNEEFLKPLGLTADASRKAMKIGITRLARQNRVEVIQDLMAHQHQELLQTFDPKIKSLRPGQNVLVHKNGF